MPDQTPTCLIRDLSETHQWLTCTIKYPLESLTCFIGNLSETNMPHQRLACLIKNPLDTDMNINKHKVYKIIIFKYTLCEFQLDSAGMSVSDGSPQACRYLMGHVCLWWGMSDYDEACRSMMGHVCLRWVSYQTCRSLMGHIGLRWGIYVSNGACRSQK